jgi:hypothetical protein
MFWVFSMYFFLFIPESFDLIAFSFLVVFGYRCACNPDFGLLCC